MPGMDLGIHSEVSVDVPDIPVLRSRSSALRRSFLD
jgi:hypothetical protein